MNEPKRYGFPMCECDATDEFHMEEMGMAELNDGGFVLWEDYERLKAEVNMLRNLVEWKPIETAPKDGYSVLLAMTLNEFRPELGEKSLSVDKCYWSDAEKGWDGYATSIRLGRLTPTHWMPLPSHPLAKDGLPKE